jgi:O-antigen/teichoic acid export membrane protein
MSESSTIAKGSFWTLFFNIINKIIAFVYTILVARLVSPEDVGTFYLVLSVLGVLFIFTDLGLLSSLSRYVPYFYGKKEIGKLRNLLKLSYFVGGGLTLLFVFLTFIFAGDISRLVGQPSIEPVLQIMTAWLLFKELNDINTGVLSGRKKMRESQSLEAIQNTLKLIITLALFYAVGASAQTISLGFLIPFLFVIPLGCYWVWQESKKWKLEEGSFTLQEQVSFSKEIIYFGIVVTLINFIWVTFQYVDRIMLSMMLPDSLDAIAVYSIASGLSTLALVFPNAILAIFFPVVSELYGKGDFEGIKRTMSISMKWTVMLAVPVTAIMVVFGKELLQLLYGGFYAQGETVLLLFVIGLFIRSVFSPPGNVLASMRRLDVEFKAAGIAVITNVAFNYLLIPVWGIDGAALGSLLSMIALFAVIVYYSRKIFSFSVPRDIYKPLVAGLILLLALFLLKGAISALMDGFASGLQSLVSQDDLAGALLRKAYQASLFGLLVAIAASAYFVLLLFLKCFGKEETELIESGLRRFNVPEGRIRSVIGFFERFS